MANLPEPFLDSIFSLQRQFLGSIDEISAIDMILTEFEGEMEQASITLEQLQNARERLRDKYLRLATLLLRIAEAQPFPPQAVIDLLQETVETGQASFDAVQATIIEIKRDWNIL
jgi:hypothetical protein